MRAATPSSGSRRRPVSTTAAPSSASINAAASPMPVPAPVTQATFPVSCGTTPPRFSSGAGYRLAARRTRGFIACRDCADDRCLRQDITEPPMPIPMLFLPPQNDNTRKWAKEVADSCPELEVIIPETREGAEQAIALAEGAFGTIPKELLPRAGHLRWLQAPQAAPPAGYYYPELIAHPVQITNFREIYNDHIAAHIMSFVLAFARGLQIYLPQQMRREWRQAGRESDDVVIHLPEATALIVGVGGIGGEAARLASAFGITVIGVDERRTEKPPGVAELHRAAALDDLLPRADFVILTVPHTPETEGFMNRARFRRMKRSAFFINIGRGMTTRLDDRADAVEAGEIAGAGLDVFEREPLPADHPLWTMPGVLITPHTAGRGPYLDERRFDVLRDNARRFLAGEALRNVVDKSRWF